MSREIVNEMQDGPAIFEDSCIVIPYPVEECVYEGRVIHDDERDETYDTSEYEVTGQYWYALTCGESALDRLYEVARTTEWFPQELDWDNHQVPNGQWEYERIDYDEAEIRFVGDDGLTYQWHFTADEEFPREL